MFMIVGLGIVMGAVLTGFLMEGGKIGALIQISELIIIAGAALGSAFVASPISVLVSALKAVSGLLKPNPYTQARFMELLQMLYDMFMLARREGLVSLDSHVERPMESEFFKKYPMFHGNHHALMFLSDTMKVIATGSVANHDLMDMMDIDLETAHEEAMKPVHLMSKLGDSMPGFGIVAAVLGVVITMGAIGGPPEEIGHKVASALVGTFLGILLAYGVFTPLATSMEARVKSEEQYMASIKCALLSFARGDAPLTAVEFARRNIDPASRPSFSDMERTLKNPGKPVAEARAA